MSRNRAFLVSGLILAVLVLVAVLASPAVSAQQPPTPSKQLRVFEFPLDSGCINTFLTADAITVRVTAAQALEDKIPTGCYPEPKPVVRALPPAPDPCKDLNIFKVYFDFDKSPIRDDVEKDTVKAAAAWIKNCVGKVNIVLSEGNCDNRGPNDYNFQLGMRRAESVSDMLQYFGVPANMINVTSFGKEKAAGTDHQEDRRVDIIVQPN